MAFFVAGKNVLMIVITKTTTTKRLNWVSYGGHRHD